MAFITGLSSQGSLLLGGAVAAAVAIGVVVVSQNDETVPDIGQQPSALTAPSVPATPVRKTIATTPVTENGAQATKTASGEDDAPTAALPPATNSDVSTLPGVALPDDQDIALGIGVDISVSATVIGDSVVASTQPGNDLAINTDPSKKPDIGATATALGHKDAPRFDLVRVDKAGSAVVAGVATPNQVVDVLIDGQVIAEVKADKRGGFVALFDIPATPDPQVLTLSSKTTAGADIESIDRVLVVGRQVSKPKTTAEISVSDVIEAAPTIIIASEDGVKVVQPAAIEGQTPDVMANVTLDLISYDEAGEVVLTGRSKPDRHVRVYVDDKPIKTGTVANDGTWKLSLPEVDAGRYVLRVDELDEAGQETSRVETPFQKEFSGDVTRTASASDLGQATGPASLPSVQKITIQPGATLWALAEARYGEGNLYMQIFEANKDNIRNPNLIYPGQIFTIPD